MPAEERRPLAGVQLFEGPGSVYPGGVMYNCHHEVYLKGQYVLITKELTLFIFRITNVALQPRGRVTRFKNTQSLYNDVAFCNDYLFQIGRDNKHLLASSSKLNSYVNQGETWISCNHPARHLWEQEDTKMLGMKQLSESKVLLLLFQQREDLLQVINLSDGTVELAAKDSHLRGVDSQRDRRSYLVYLDEQEQGLSNMDSFGLIIRSNKLRHFSFGSQEHTWEMELLENFP